MILIRRFKVSPSDLSKFGPALQSPQALPYSSFASREREARISFSSPPGAVVFRSVKTFSRVRGARVLGGRDKHRASNLRQQMLRAGKIDLAGRFFDIELFHHPVFDQHRIALGAYAETAPRGVELEAGRFGEIAVAVGEEAHFAVGAGRLRPGGENVMIIDRGHRDRIDALGLEAVFIGDEARQMVFVASRRESAGKAEEDDPLRS